MASLAPVLSVGSSAVPPSGLSDAESDPAVSLVNDLSLSHGEDQLVFPADQPFLAALIDDTNSSDYSAGVFTSAASDLPEPAYPCFAPCGIPVVDSHTADSATFSPASSFSESPYHSEVSSPFDFLADLDSDSELERMLQFGDSPLLSSEVF
eukprot:TRINITY_DN922_c0_g1_i1.p1 TRINITY_DN922_c0_g1~~TRINITY_DN922_c0_g1_i1.p1  ORF type:complete len:152 (+),score=15.76 TRINITY_DN922_c0_g1_i1:547-1002(+)